MSNLTNGFIETKTMTSLQIAELTGKQHFHVLRDIDDTFAALNPNLGLGLKSTTYEDKSGKLNKMYLLDEDSTLLLVTGYDVNSRMKVIKRWKELESKNTPLTYKESLMRLYEAECERERLVSVITNQSETIKEDAILTEKSQDYYTVKQLKGLVSKPSGKVLTRVSNAMKYEIKSVFSQYDNMSSNTYHVDVINAVYNTNL